jgi:hypothetical protein
MVLGIVTLNNDAGAARERLESDVAKGHSSGCDRSALSNQKSPSEERLNSSWTDSSICLTHF